MDLANDLALVNKLILTTNNSIHIKCFVFVFFKYQMLVVIFEKIENRFTTIKWDEWLYLP